MAKWRHPSVERGDRRLMRAVNREFVQCSEEEKPGGWCDVGMGVWQEFHSIFRMQNNE